MALREAARRLGRTRLADATIFTTLEPCAMCVGRLAGERCRGAGLRRPERGRRCGRDRPPARAARLAAATDQGRQRHPARRGCGALRRRPHRLRGARLPVWYPLPRRGVRVVDGAALEKRCAKAPRVRIPPSPPQTVVSDRPMPALARPRVHSRTCGCARSRAPRRLGLSRPTRRSGPGLGHRPSGRGRLVDYGAALEMRFGATRRGFESRPLRHTRPAPGRPGVRWLLRSSLTHLGVRSLRSSIAAFAWTSGRRAGSGVPLRPGLDGPRPGLTPVAGPRSPPSPGRRAEATR